MTAALALCAGALLAAEDPGTFRQRHKLDPVKAKANAERVAGDMAEAKASNSAVAVGKGNLGGIESLLAPGGYEKPYRSIFFEGLPSCADSQDCE